MKKIVLTLILIIFAVSIYAASFTVFGKVYNEDGSKGTSLTANSYCGLKVYRKSIPGEIGVQNIGPDENCIQKIFPAYFGGQDTAAYFNSDVGSNNWTTVTSVGQSVIAVVEVYNGQFPLCPWNGASYTGARIMVLSQQNIDNGGVDMPDTRLETIPAPQPQTILSDSITLTWRGLSYDPDNLIKGYTVYRSTEPGGAGGYTQLTVTADQVKGGTVYFTDTGLNQDYNYYYKIAVNFEWGGGNGAPDYFISNAMSDASIGIYMGPSPTITQTETNTPVYTPTYTFTETYTCTFTYSPTDTITATDTITITETPTFTDTPTLTHTLTFTPTISFTMTVTFSNTYTQTFTATITDTLTLTPTITPTMIITPQPQIAELLKNKLLREKIVILNNPVRDGMLKIALYNENNAIVYFSLYNISGELVMQFNRNINGGFAMVQEKISKAPGIYILRTVVKTDTETINLPLKKVGVIKN
jgi:hypothetical protein